MSMRNPEEPFLNTIWGAICVWLFLFLIFLLIVCCNHWSRAASIELNWENPKDSKYINVWTSPEYSGPWSLVDPKWTTYTLKRLENNIQSTKTLRLKGTGITGTSYLVENVTTDTPHYFSLTALDDSANESSRSMVTSAIVLDKKSPRPPENVSIIIRDSSGRDRKVEILLKPVLITGE